jgi:hypothetical protein
VEYGFCGVHTTPCICNSAPAAYAFPLCTGGPIEDIYVKVITLQSIPVSSTCYTYMYIAGHYVRDLYVVAAVIGCHPPAPHI